MNNVVSTCYVAVFEGMGAGKVDTTIYLSRPNDLAGVKEFLKFPNVFQARNFIRRARQVQKVQVAA